MTNQALKYVGKRFLRIVFTLFIVATVLFVLFRMLSGDPVKSVMSPGMTQDTIDRLRAQFGLNQPLWKQYLLYLKNMFTFQFGQSFRSLKPVWEILQYRLVNTLYLMVTSLVLTYLFAYYAGVFLAWNRGTARDLTSMVVAILGQGIPPFVTGIFMIMFFALTLRLFPIGGMVGTSTVQGGVVETLTDLDFWHHLVLPLITNSFFFLATPLLLMRGNMITQLKSNYIDYLYAKGIPERRIMFKHAARNSLLPFLTQIALTFGYMIGGQVLVETVFSWPGMGKLLVDSVLSSDYPVAQASFFLIAMVVMIANFLVDIMYSYFDPRIGSGGDH